MSRKKFSRKLGAIFFALSVIVFATLPLALHADDDDQCETADGYLAEGMYGVAEILYKKILDEDDTVTCAAIGLERIAREREYQKVIALRDAGMDDKAWAQLEEALKADPENEQLKDLAVEPWAGWQRNRSEMTLYIIPLAKLVLALIIIVTLLYLLSDYFGRRSRLVLDLEEFSLGALKLDPDPGSELLALVESALKRIGTVSDTLSFGLLSEPLQEVSFPASVAVASEAGQLWDFFISLWPTNRIALTAVLGYDKQKGAGITLKLVDKRSNRIYDQETIWQSALNPNYAAETDAKAADFFAMAEAAAIWTFWKFYEMECADDQEREAFLRRSFGTDDWSSYAINYLAVDYLVAANMDDAVRVLHNALKYDHENRFALYNLAKTNVDVSEPDQDLDLANRYLDRVIKLGPTPMDRVSVYAKYQLGANETYKHIIGKNGDLAGAMQDFHAAWAAANSNSSLKIGEEAQDAFYVAYAYAAVLADRPYSKNEIKKLDDKEHFELGFVYNLACFYSVVASKNPASSPEAKDATQKALHNLKKALSINRAYIACLAPIDPSLKYLWKNEQFKKLVEGPKEDIASLTFPYKDLAKIKSNLGDLKPGDTNVTAILATIEEDSETKIVTHTGHSYEELTVIDLLDDNGHEITQAPYKDVKTIRIKLPLSDKAIGTKFAAHVEAATAVYLLSGEETATFWIKYGRDGQFYYSLMTSNRAKILKSEGYKTKNKCKDGIDSVKRNAPSDEQYEKTTTRAGKYRFNLKTKNGEVIGSSVKGYDTEEKRDEAIVRVKRLAPSAGQFDVT